MASKLQTVINEIGFFNTLLYGINIALSKINIRQCIFHYVFFAQPVLDKPVLPERRGKSIQIKQIFHDDPVLAELPPPEHVISSRFMQGALCFGAFQNEELLGCIWLILSPYNEDEVRCCFHPQPNHKSSWDFDVYIKPERRTSFAFAKLWDETNRFLRERNIEWTFSRISAFNVVSLASHKRLGAMPIGNAIYIKIWRWQIMFANIKPYLYVSTGDSSIPHLFLNPPVENKS